MTEKNDALAISVGTRELGDVFVKSGLFKDAGSKEQAIVKILAGREIGISPIASMTGIHIIKNQIAIGANLMAAAVKNSGKYDYKVTKHTDKECSIDFYEGETKLGTSPFTMDDADRAGVYMGKDGSWYKWPRNMLFARALSNGVKWYCPDVFGHAPVYTPEELGAKVDEDGEPINITPVEPQKGPDTQTSHSTHVPPPQKEMSRDSGRKPANKECSFCGTESVPIREGHKLAGKLHCPKCFEDCPACDFGILHKTLHCHTGTGIMCDNDDCKGVRISEKPAGWGLYDDGLSECKKCPLALLCSEDYKVFDYDGPLVGMDDKPGKYPYTFQLKKLEGLVEATAEDDNGDSISLENTKTHAGWKKSWPKGDEEQREKAEVLAKEILLRFFNAK